MKKNANSLWSYLVIIMITGVIAVTGPIGCKSDSGGGGGGSAPVVTPEDDDDDTTTPPDDDDDDTTATDDDDDTIDNCVDVDGDGYGADCSLGTDCDDSLVTGAGCNTDCLTFFEDSDGDGYGNAITYTTACTAPAGYVANDDDCDNASVEHWSDCGVCVDDDGDNFGSGCDLGPDCDDSLATGTVCHTSCSDFYDDSDGDSFGDSALSVAACYVPTGFVSNSTDCDAADAAHWSDCAVCTDADGDDYGSSCNLGPDCDDDSVTGASCNDACNIYYRDTDSDTYGDLLSSLDACVLPVGYVSDNSDCAPGDADHWADCGSCSDTDGDGYGPGCDLGSDCDDDPITGDSCNTGCATYYTDVDSDSYGDDAQATVACVTPSGYVDNNTDCAPADASHWSDCGVCSDSDGDNYGTGCDLGDDCDPADAIHWSDCSTCTGTGDVDGDGYGDGCNLADCDDTAATGAPCYDGCTTFYDDTDADGYGNPATAADACSIPAGYVADNTDCDPASAIHWADCGTCTGAGDLDADGYGSGCDLADCDDTLATGTGCYTGCDIYYDDTDGDGYGAPMTSATACTTPVDYVSDNSDCDPSSAMHWSDCGSCTDADGDGYGSVCDLGPDCDDSDANANPALTEIYYNGINDDCDALTIDDDQDGDGVTSNAETGGDPDCDDIDQYTFPGAATHNHAALCMRDEDGDDYGDGWPSPWVVGGTDCDDTDPGVEGGCFEAVKVAAGQYHTCALLDTGAVRCWGLNSYGQLGEGGVKFNYSSPVDVTGLSSGVADISAGEAHTCALLDTGAVKCWGKDNVGQLGDGGSNTNQSTPVDVSGLSSGVEAIAVGHYHTCALLDTGAVQCWGSDSYGQLGDGGTNTNQSFPVAVTGFGSDVDAISAGGYHTCAVLSTGAAMCWGQDNAGQLGDGGTNTEQSTPVAVSGLSSGVWKISAGRSHTCALLDTGAAKCWGYDGYGQLGDGGTNTEQSTPVDVSGLSIGVEEITVGGFHTCAQLVTGGMKCWGFNSYGQLGDVGESYDSQSTPVDVSGLSFGVTAITAGMHHTCAVLGTGLIKCWGSDEDGQLGDGAINNNQATAVDVSGLSSGVAAMAAGSSHSCALLDSGAVKCWGRDSYGQLGDGGTNTDQSTSVDVSGFSTGVTDISAGSDHTCAVFDTGAVKCWGRDSYGQLGDGGTNTSKSTPVDVSGLSSGVVAISAGNYHTCALLNTGAVKCWGRDSYGQLGDGGTNTNQSTPVEVSGLSLGVAAISAGGSHTCALLDTGAVKCWGTDSYGQLGDGVDLVEQSTPVDVSGLSSGVAAIAAGNNHTCAILDSGAAKCWGYGARGQRGDGVTNTTQPTPVDVSGLSSGGTAISAGYNHTCALFDTDSVKCWGDDGYGQLGDGWEEIEQLTPVDVGSAGVEAIVAGDYHTCALLDTGAMRCWGRSNYSQLGIGETQKVNTPVNVLGF
jgi:alpha-tubulin suppressor-like RCC1 family protein